MKTIGFLLAGFEFGIVYASYFIRHTGKMGTGIGDATLAFLGLVVLLLATIK